MSTATLDRPTSTAWRRRLPRVEVPAEAPAPRCTAPPIPQQGPHGGHRTLFTVPLHSAMEPADIRRLARAAGLDCDLVSKLRGDTVSPGLRRLDFASGLFLVRGEREGEWRLEARTWGAPASGAVRRWELWAASAARVVDSEVAS